MPSDWEVTTPTHKPVSDAVESLRIALKILAPGKINLALEVLGKRDDGFHEIRSLMVSVGLHDELRFTPTESEAITLTCDDADIPCDGSNLIHRAAMALRHHTGVMRGCEIDLVKRIPIGAGMGGGSSDAATTLLALNELWQLNLDRKRLSVIGADIGSDVPFFFWPNGAKVSGRGERIEPVELKWRGWVGLVSSGDHVSTPEVYRCCKPNVESTALEVITKLNGCMTAAEMSALLCNDLEAGVFEVAPQVCAMRDALIESGVADETLRVTGAGSVLFQLFDDEVSANAFATSAKSCPLVSATWVARVPASRQRSE